MREIEIHIHSVFYKIYRDSLSRWEYAPTRASLLSFIYAIFIHLLKKPLIYKRQVFNALFIFAALMTSIMALEAIGDAMNAGIFIPLVAIMAICTSITMWSMALYKRIYGVILRKTGRVTRWFKRITTIPTIRFTGHPSSMYDIEKFSE